MDAKEAKQGLDKLLKDMGFAEQQDPEEFDAVMTSDRAICIHLDNLVLTYGEAAVMYHIKQLINVMEEPCSK